MWQNGTGANLRMSGLGPYSKKRALGEFEQAIAEIRIESLAAMAMVRGFSDRNG